MTVVENTIPESSVTPRKMLLSSDAGLPIEKMVIESHQSFHNDSRYSQSLT